MPVLCSCCSNTADDLNADLISETLALPRQCEVILKAIWSGHGQPVEIDAIYKRMYLDADDRPEPAAMYNAFKVSLFKLRRALKGTGVVIVNHGYARGYRLVLHAMRADAA